MSVLLREVRLRNFKSIARCRVGLGSLTLLVGPNGSGKSNFLDALRLVKESLQGTLELALRKRGGIGEVRRMSGGHPNHFAIQLDLALSDGCEASFAFRIGAAPDGGFKVQREKAVVRTSVLGGLVGYEVNDGTLTQVSADLPTLPRPATDRLFLTAVSGIDQFRGLFDGLGGMGFYSINPAVVRELQPHDKGELLDESGLNLPSVIKRLQSDDRVGLERITQYLREVIPGCEGIAYHELGPRGTIRFLQRVQSQQHPWKFFASSMSDGTLRSLGVLVALFQRAARTAGPTPLVAVEEPESTVHPGAAGALMAAMIEASASEQVIATTHSPDLLDHPGITDDMLLCFESHEGETRIGRVDPASRSAIRDRLFSAGELLRARQLEPDPEDFPAQASQLGLFEDQLA